MSKSNKKLFRSKTRQAIITTAFAKPKCKKGTGFGTNISRFAQKNVNPEKKTKSSEFFFNTNLNWCAL